MESEGRFVACCWYGKGDAQRMLEARRAELWRNSGSICQKLMTDAAMVRDKSGFRLIRVITTSQTIVCINRLRGSLVRNLHNKDQSCLEMLPVTRWSRLKPEAAAAEQN